MAAGARRNVDEMKAMKLWRTTRIEMAVAYRHQCMKAAANAAAW